MEGALTKLNLENDNYSVLIDQVPSSNVLLVSFGGIANRLPIPVFEFMRSLDPYNINKVFIRDFNQCWYTSGIRGISGSPLETISYLSQLIHRMGSKKCVFMGNSAGGYAAMLYGQSLGISEVHAFSPQTFIDRWHRLIFWDRRWPTEIKKLNPEFSSFFDLKRSFREYPKDTAFNIYWDKRHRLDNIHALRMKGANIRHSAFDGGGHAVIKQMKASGKLDELLKNALTT